MLSLALTNCCGKTAQNGAMYRRPLSAVFISIDEYFSKNRRSNRNLVVSYNFWHPLYRFPNSRKRTLFPPIQKRKPQYSYRKSSFSGEKKNTLCCAVRPPEQAMAFDKCQPAKLLFMYPLILQFDTTTTHQQQKTQTNKPRTNINTSPQQHSNNRQLPTAVATVESTASTHSSSKTYQKPKASQHLLPEPRLILITHRKEE